MTRKFALVIGNSHYEDPALARLKAPEADVHALASVLRDPAIGGFDEVQELVDEPEHNIRRAIATFFANKAPNDLLLLYASGHGVLDEQGRLYLATRDTQRNLLNATAIPASFITDDMDTCRSKRQVLILDCCHSGAFARGAKGELAAITQATFEGNGFGRVVLTASDSTQYALEGDQIDESVSLSLFTNYLLEGLTTGEADRGGDGWVDVDEWYDYAYEKILMQTSSQTPKKWAYNTQGELVIARNPRPKPVELPRYLRTAIGSELPRVRLEAVDQLENLLSNGAPGIASVAVEVLQRMAQNDDSLIVRRRAGEVLAAHSGIISPATGTGFPAEAPASQSLQDLQAIQEREKQAREQLEKERIQQAEAQRLQQEQERIRRQQEQERQAQLAQQARQQELLLARLDALYKTALAKYEAGEWQAAQSSLEQLQQLKPGYGDSAKLQKKIDQEIAREKSERERQAQQARQARLEAKYQDASQAVQREDWPEAQRLFQELAQEAPGYRDVSKRLKAISDRLAGETFPVPARSAWLPVLATSLGWGIGWALLVAIDDKYRYDNIFQIYDNSFFVAIIPTLLIAAGVVYSFKLASLPLSSSRLVQLFLLWWGGSLLALGIIYEGVEIIVLMISIVLLLATFAGTGLLLRASMPTVRWVSILGGWVGGLIAGIVVILILSSIFNYYGIDSVATTALGFGLAGLIIGAAGGGWMHRQFGAFSGQAVAPAFGAPKAGEPGAGRLQAGAPLAASTWSNWLPVLITGLGWGTGWALLSPLLNSGQIFLGAMIPALFMAAGIVAAINRVAGKLVSRVRLGQLFVLWWVGIALALGFAAMPALQGSIVPTVVIPNMLILATFAGTGLLLRASIPGVSWLSILSGLLLALVVGIIVLQLTRPFLPYEDLHIFSLHDLGSIPALGFGGLVAGLISVGWIRRQLRRGDG